MITKELLSIFENIVSNFEYEKSIDKKKSRDSGTIYTPQKLAAYIVDNTFNYYLSNILSGEFSEKQMIFDIKSLVNNLNSKLKNLLFQKVKVIKILDPACGSGRFLIEVAEFLMRLWRTLNSDVKEFEAKKFILANNVYGVDRDDRACFVSKLRLLVWLFSEKTTDIGAPSLNSGDFDDKNEDAHDKFLEFLVKSGINLNIICSDFLLEFETQNKTNFDIILGNPPYVENKKMKDLGYKNKLYEKFNSAFRLFDLSILFIERSLELLKPM